MVTGFENLISAAIAENSLTGSDVEIADALNALDVTDELRQPVYSYSDIRVDEVALCNILGYADCMGFLATLDAIPAMASARAWLKLNPPRISLADPVTLSMMQSLVTAGAITQALCDRVFAPAKRRLKWWEQKIGRLVTHLDVASAMGRDLN